MASPASQARGDAAALARAHTVHARMTAIETIAKHLELGVYTTKGHTIVRGSERGRLDLYLYEPEVQALAEGLPARRESLDDLAGGFGRLGVHFSGRTLDGAGFARLVAARIGAAQRNGGLSFAYAALLLRDLGLGRGVDLARVGSTSRAVIDPVQALILDLAVVRPGLVAFARHGAEDEVSSAPGPGPSARAASACDDPISSQTGTQVGGAQALIGMFSNSIGSVAGVATGVGDLLDMFHGIVLGIDVEFRPAGPATVLGQFGTHGPGSAADMKFKAQVHMTVNLPQSVVDCGALLGYTFPTSGGVSGIKVGWQLNGTGPNLGELGTVKCDRSSCRSTAGDDGVATLVVKPDDEWLPGIGTPVTSSGAITARAYTLSSTGSTLGKVDEGLGITKFVTFGWGMSWHQPRGYQVTLPAINETQNLYGQTIATSVTYTAIVECLISGKNGADVPHPTTPRPELGVDPAYAGNDNKQIIVNTFDGQSPPPQETDHFAFDAAVANSPQQSYQFDTGGGQTVTVHPRFTLTAGGAILDVGLDVPSALSPGSRHITGTVADVTNCPTVPIPH